MPLYSVGTEDLSRNADSGNFFQLDSIGRSSFWAGPKKLGGMGGKSRTVSYSGWKWWNVIYQVHKSQSRIHTPHSHKLKLKLLLWLWTQCFYFTIFSLFFFYASSKNSNAPPQLCPFFFLMIIMYIYYVNIQRYFSRSWFKIQSYIHMHINKVQLFASWCHGQLSVFLW